MKKVKAKKLELLKQLALSKLHLIKLKGGSNIQGQQAKVD